MPTLVLDGDLDSLTSPEGPATRPARFPNSTFVETANMIHVSALVDFDQCASLIVRRFVRTGGDAGDTSCAAATTRTGWSTASPAAAGDRLARRRYRTARVATATLGRRDGALAVDVHELTASGCGVARSAPAAAPSGRAHPVVRWRLDHVRWVRDVAVTGTIRWYRHSGLIRAHVHVTGTGAQPSDLTLRWNDLDRHPRALAQGVAGGQRVRFVFPAP